MLDTLLEYKADLAKQDNIGKTALHHGCSNSTNNLDIVKQLLSRVRLQPDLTPARACSRPTGCRRRLATPPRTSLPLSASCWSATG